MKKLILSVFYLLSLYSNAQISWERPYGGPTHAVLADMIHVPGNYFYACGRDTLGGASQALLTKFDSLGNTLWEKTYTIQDSTYRFDNMLLFDNNTILIQAAAYPNINGVYSVPKIILIDTTGTVIDSTWPDISSVYNGTSNMDLFIGANNTFWNFHYVGTIGISNEVWVTRYDSTLQPVYGFVRGAFYDYQYSMNKKGEMVFDVFIDQLDSILGLINPDAILLRDTTGTVVFDSIYMQLDPSIEILRTEDSGFTLFYENNDSLQIRHFDSNGIQQRLKNYYTGNLYWVIDVMPAADSAYFAIIEHYDFASGSSDYMILKISEEDDTLWSQKFDSPYTSPFISMKPCLDGGAVLIFRNNLIVDSVNYLVRLGPNGERFPFTLIKSPDLYCQGDTVTFSVSSPAQSYLWSTGDTTSVLHVTTSGNYGVTVTDSAGNSFLLHPYSIVFDASIPITVSDVHTCNPSVTLTSPFVSGNTLWSHDEYDYYTGNSITYYRDTIPDTLQYWMMRSSSNGCRSGDTATIYFDACPGIEELTISGLHIKILSENSILLQTKTGENISQILMFNITGRMVKQLDCRSSELLLDISKLTSGVYILQCIISGKENSQKIVVRK